MHLSNLCGIGTNIVELLDQLFSHNTILSQYIPYRIQYLAYYLVIIQHTLYEKSYYYSAIKKKYKDKSNHFYIDTDLHCL